MTKTDEGITTKVNAAEPVDYDFILRSLSEALKNHQDKTRIIPIAPYMQSMVRQNDKRPAMIALAVDDQMVKNMKGDPERCDLYVLLWIPRAAAETIRKQRESPIIQPPKGVVLPSSGR